MKIFFPIAFLLFILTTGFFPSPNPVNQKEEKEQSRHFRKHKVKTITITQCFFRLDTLEKEGNLFELQKIDPQGNVIDDKKYSPTGDMSIHDISTYSAGKLVRMEQWDYRRIIDTSHRVWSFSYDPQGRLATQTDHLRDGLRKATWKYKYDASSRITEASLGTNSKEGRSAETWTFSYDSSGNVSRQDFYGLEGSHTILGYKYNSDGVLIEFDSYWAEGKIQTRRLYGYNEKLQLVEFRVLGSTGLLYSNDEYAYNTDGLVATVKHSDKNGAQYVLMYKYEFYK
jgi:YD repeat-containing protein